jgi:hypothetical protein
MSWTRLELNLPDVGVADLTSIIAKLKDFLNTLVNILEVLAALYSALSDPLVALIKSVVEKLKETVESFLEDLGGYVLYVPIRKRLRTDFLGLGDITPNWAGSLGIFGNPNSPIAWDSPELGKFLVDTNRYNGGNAGFFKTVIDSLNDEGDTNRPTFFSESDYVGGTVLVMGTDFDPLGFLDDIWKFSGLFDGPNLLPKVPRPKNLKVRTLNGISGGSFSTLLLWDPPEVPVHTLEDLGGVVLFPSRYAIIRGRNTVGALTATSVIDLMGKRDLHTGDTFSNGNTVVVFEGDYDISKMSYLDEGVSAEEADSFYYAVAWKLRAFNAGEDYSEGNGTDIDYWHISNVVRVTPFPTLPASTPPDWLRTPSIASIFPQFAAVLRLMVAQIEAFSARLVGGDTMLRNYVDFLKSEVLRYEKIVQDILDDLSKLSSKLSLPTAGVYMRTFKGVGGNDFLISDLAASLLPSFPGAPPFHRGDEYVTGAVLLAGGPETLVDGFISALSWIFGTPSNDGMSEMLEELGEAITLVEETTFGADLTAQEAVTTVETATAITNDPLFRSPICRGIVPAASTFGPNLDEET